MPRFAANLSMMYGEHAFLTMGAAAAKTASTPSVPVPLRLSGRRDRRAVEGQRPAAGALQRAAGRLGGGRARPGCCRAQDEFPRRRHEGDRYAKALNCPRIHLMPASRRPASAMPRCRRLRNNLGWAAARLATSISSSRPINTRDIPASSSTARTGAPDRAARERAQPQVQMDLYHCQIVEGDLAKLEAYLPGGRVGHLQIAGVPGATARSRRVSYRYLFERIDALGYPRRHRRRIPAARWHLGGPGLVQPWKEPVRRIVGA